MSDDNLDKFVYGAERIGREANLVKDDGSVDLRKAYYALENGLYQWLSFFAAWTVKQSSCKSRFVTYKDSIHRGRVCCASFAARFSVFAHRPSQPLKAMRRVAKAPAIASAKQPRRIAITAANLAPECT